MRKNKIKQRAGCGVRPRSQARSAAETRPKRVSCSPRRVGSATPHGFTRIVGNVKSTASHWTATRIVVCRVRRVGCVHRVLHARRATRMLFLLTARRCPDGLLGFPRSSDSTVFDAKRVIGRRSSCHIVQRDMRQLSFGADQGDGDKPLTVVGFKAEMK